MSKVDITLDQSSVTKLFQGGFWLYALIAVKSSDQAGRPLLWQRWQPTQLAQKMVVGWTDALDAYTSTSPIQARQQVTVGFSAGIQVGQTLQVSQAGGGGTVVSGGSQGAVTILNQTQVQYTGGICRKPGDSGAEPVCAFPVYPGFSEVITPVEKVLLMFSTSPLQLGTVIEGSLPQAGSAVVTALLATSPGVLIDCTGSDERDVRFNLSTGWSCDDAVWCKSVSSNADLVTLLIEPKD